MNSVTLYPKTHESVVDLIQKIKSRGTNLELASTTAEAKDLNELRRSGRDIVDEMDGLLIIGDKNEISESLDTFFPNGWTSLIVHDNPKNWVYNSRQN